MLHVFKIPAMNAIQMKGEVYASDASTDLQLDYELICKIIDDLEKEGKMEAAK
jgi:hypothetical protein